MDDQATIKIHGNTDLSASTVERPLVTFALFAYNQEKYIQEAIEGAFAQTYQPLEIILSDDCSSDRTFEIMESMAREYNGRHLVKLRRGEINFGTAQHIFAVSKISSGDIIVIAAGDDVSESHRCDVVVAHWKEAGFPKCCIHSSAVFFEESSGLERTVPARTPTLKGEACLKFALQDKLPFLSPTCVYSKALFSDYAPLIGGSIIEDGILALRSLASQNVISVKDQLVRIRISSQTSGTGYSIRDPQRWNQFILSRTISYFTKLRDLQNTGFDKKTTNRLQRMYRKKISLLSQFVIPSSLQLSSIQRLIFLFNYVVFYPSASQFTIKLADGLKLCGYFNSKPVKFFYNIMKRRLN